MSRGLMKDVWERGREAILGAQGLDLLRFARTLGLGDPTAEADPEIVRRASELGWCREQRGRVLLTEIGSIVSDSAREYINWIEDGRTLQFPLETEVAGKRVLDVGCGWGRYVLTMRNLGADCTGIDVSEAYLQLGKILAEREGVEHLSTVRGSAERLPFEDAAFDLVCCIRSFAYMNQPEALLEFARVLKPSGRLIIATPTIEMWLRRWRGHWLRLTGSRKRLRWVLNSYSTHWFGKRPFFLPAGLNNPAYPTLSFMTSLETFDFHPVDPYPVYHGETAWFMLEHRR
jgi:2-polyprenyl-3-methyl-5-hydroxy-6-metoxy-1,4-benzoquinol methylase